jgi:hypothetical protein
MGLRALVFYNSADTASEPACASFRLTFEASFFYL